MVTTKIRRRRFLHLSLAAAALSIVGRTAKAQPYPSRPIRLVVPFPPGGVYDATGRPWAERAKVHLGTIVIENIGGAGSSLGTAAVARAQPDGYTILLGGSSGLVINPIASTKPLYDPVNHFEPIAILGRNPTAIAVHPDQPMRTLKELIDDAKANPGKLSYGSSGVGTPNHLLGERLKWQAALDMPHVPYRGAGPAMSDLISGHIPVLYQSVTGQAIEMHKAGRMRMLAITSEERLAALPEVPTVAEAGMPFLASRQFIGLFAPKGTPKAIVEQIAIVARLALAENELRRQFIAAGFEPDPDSNPDKARQTILDEIAEWTPVIRAIGLKLD
jgi:tripartite-type tricarboxylate transporter receptor subunit TctC